MGEEKRSRRVNPTRDGGGLRAVSIAHSRQAASLSLLVGVMLLSTAACTPPTATTPPSPVPPSTTSTYTPTNTPTATETPSPTASASTTPSDNGDPPATRTAKPSPTPVDPLALGMPSAGPLSLVDVDEPRLVHWFEGRSESRLLVVRDPDGAVVATWRPPDGAEIRHLSEALSPDGRYLTWLSGRRPDDNLVGPIDPPLTLHIQDLLTGEERLSRALLHPGILENLRQQVLTVEGWGERRGGGGDDGNDWTPSWERPGQWPAVFFTGVIQGVFTDGIGRTAWSPDGSKLAVVAALGGPTSDVYLLDRSSFTMRHLTREPEHVTQIDWSPDGRQLIFSAGLEPASYSSRYRALYLLDTESGADHRFPPVEPDPRGPSGPMTSMFDSSRLGNVEDRWPAGWTRHGQAITVWGVNGCVYCTVDRYDPISGEETAVLPGYPPGPYDLSTMPWGDWAAVAGTELQQGKELLPSGTYLIDLVEGKMQRVDELPRELRYWGLADMPFLMLDSARSQSWTGERPTAVPMAPVVFGPDGRRMPIESLPGWNVAVSPDGRWRVACGSNACKVYGDGPRPVGGWTNLPVEEPAMANLQFSPDSTQLAFRSRDSLYLVDIPDGTPRRLSAWTRVGYNGEEAFYWDPLSDSLAWFGSTAQ